MSEHEHYKCFALKLDQSEQVSILGEEGNTIDVHIAKYTYVCIFAKYRKY